VKRVETGSGQDVFRRQPRGGFTLIEMLVVIGIILLLMTIGVLGFRSMERSNTEKATRTALVNGEALLKEMNSVGALALIEGPADASQAPVYVTGSNVANPGAVGSTGSGRTAAITNCQKMMRVLRANPKNRTAIANLPSNLLMPTPSGGTPYDPPVLIDAWGFPLIYVPSGGMTGVNFADNGATNQTITSSGATNSPQNRGFWASAGPDGDFSTGGDNLYSFGQ
jgi:prepilin-type N-terminal cleavage/methylation domain-containing protein